MSLNIVCHISIEKKAKYDQIDEYSVESLSFPYCSHCNKIFADDQQSRAWDIITLFI